MSGSGAGAPVAPFASGEARNVAVIGVGYVGLPTAATLARLGHYVVCGDADPDKVAMLQRGQVPIVEDQLEELVGEGLATGHLRFVLGATAAVEGAEFVFLCVPTPQGEDGSADLSFVESVAREIGPHLRSGTVIVNKSTVPVGSTLVVERVLGRHDVMVVSNPEFLREGTAVADSLNPERIVVGAGDQAAAARVGALFAGTHAPLLITDAATAETIKYASNAFLATKLSFVNAVASLCEAVGADVRDVILGLGYDKRIGFEYLRPGPGWGGSCLPKDTRALVHIADQAGYDFSFLRGAIATNEEQFVRVVRKVLDALPGGGAGRKEAPAAGAVVAVWGLTFKAGTDDLRNSPAVEVVRRLVEEGAQVRAFDPTVGVPDGAGDGPVARLPEASTWNRAAGGELRAVPDAYTACAGAAVLVVLTEWDEFRWLDFAKVAEAMATPAVVDARNLLDPAQLRRLGFTYTGIGRP
ncbi:MAG: UDP-glucose/GDP-mannose dehydrogenase family protein [Acidimicrobiales bacterium]|nr:UDP-glucose/GDP-mannose dehydrogenase family protein [Acidimicrobiales bacterium]